MSFKIISVVGARPQFIKAAAVSRALNEADTIEESILHTGQHYDDNMSSVFFDELNIPLPKFNLNVGSGSHGKQTGVMLEKIEQVLIEQHPDLVLIYGDTNSTLAAALASVKLHIPVAHVEAGLRSFNRNMPEEINRIVSDQLSEYLFCPTETAVKNLTNEGLSKETIHLVGDVMYDAALFYKDKAMKNTRILSSNDLNKKDYILATIHRAENTNDIQILTKLFQQLNDISKTTKLVLPLHPRTKNILEKNNLLSELTNHIKLIEPVSYLEMIALEANAQLIITDSGGVQKEAYFYRVPCVTVRDQTEWVELIENDWNILVPQNEFSQLGNIVNNRINHQGKEVSLYGGGHSSQHIASILS